MYVRELQTSDVSRMSNGGVDESSMTCGLSSSSDCIQLAACEVGELLPMNPELPADIFTSCLTTPIKVALRWFAATVLIDFVA